MRLTNGAGAAQDNVQVTGAPSCPSIDFCCTQINTNFWQVPPFWFESWNTGEECQPHPARSE